MVVTGFEEADAIDADLRVVEHAPGGQLPVALFRFRLGQRDHLFAADVRRARLVRRIGRAYREWAGREFGENRHHRPYHLEIQVHRYRSDRQYQQQRPQPDTARAVQVEIEPVTALFPTKSERLAPGITVGK